MAITGVAFTIAFLLGCVLALVRHPIYGLVAYVAAFYVHPPSRWWGQGILLEVRWALVAAGVTLLGILIHRSSRTDPGFFSYKLVPGLLLFAAWVVAQYLWVIDQDQHRELIEYYFKFLMAMYLIYRAIENEAHLKIFLWAHVLGCFYFGWIAFTTYAGGRFEGFGGAGIAEANAGALTIASGILVAGSLFLYGSVRLKALLLLVIPFLINGVVTTISRSGFLALAAGGLVYNLFAPRRFTGRVRLFSVLALLLLAMLTNPFYWARIQSIKYKGADVEGIDTGGGRLVIMRAQLRMFRDHPFGCGHFCTELLSPSYLPPENLDVRSGTRASHNTFLSLAVDQGAPGALAYVGMLAWVLVMLRKLAARCRRSEGFVATMLPAVAGFFAAMTVADLFVPYVRYEIRFWFLALLMVMLKLVTRDDGVASARLTAGGGNGVRGRK